MKTIILKLSGLFPYADKILHFIAGALIALLILIIVNTPWFGFAGAFLAGLYKEFSDHTKAQSGGGKATWLDWFATMAGGLFIELIW